MCCHSEILYHVVLVILGDPGSSGVQMHNIERKRGTSKAGGLTISVVIIVAQELMDDPRLEACCLVKIPGDQIPVVSEGDHW